MLLKIIRKTSTAFVGIENLEEEVLFFPPCIAALDSRLSQGFHMEHYEYLQLGFFLREAGMSFKDYQRYWYFRHPSNRGKSWEEFSTSHWGDYQLRQQYGLTGGGTEYRAFSCKKAQAEAFCPFKDFNTDEIALFIQSYLEKEGITENDANRIKNGIKKIRGLVRKRYFGAACATEYELRFKEKTDWINHPILSYYKNAKMLNRRRKKTILQEDGSRPDKKDGRSITRS
jgi:DNA primase large subunit